MYFYHSLHYSTGFALENDVEAKLTCGTEKGKHKAKNHSTAGIVTSISTPHNIVLLFPVTCEKTCKMQ